LNQLTFLLDLDDTLLINPMDRFLPAYFGLLEKRLAGFIGEEPLRQLMYRSVQVMMAKADPAVTNLAAFMDDFAQRLGVPLELIQPTIEEFYRDDYPHLRQHTLARPEAKAVITTLIEQGQQVVIATNPLFPATAIMQRISWAEVHDFAYALITTMDNSHFCKPDPRYYQEILDKVGAAPEATWMVGDDVENDILPARSLGLKTWWITSSPSASAQADRQGTLSEFLAWLKTGNLLGKG
jgi:HAD superfamily hydrolase (TIGR01549 family)